LKQNYSQHDLHDTSVPKQQIKHIIPETDNTWIRVEIRIR